MNENLKKRKPCFKIQKSYAIATKINLNENLNFHTHFVFIFKSCIVIAGICVKR